MERPTLRNPTRRRLILTPTGWLQFAKRRGLQKKRLSIWKNTRLPGRSIVYNWKAIGWY